jgi:hypothetical protein
VRVEEADQVACEAARALGEDRRRVRDKGDERLELAAWLAGLEAEEREAGLVVAPLLVELVRVPVRVALDVALKAVVVVEVVVRFGRKERGRAAAAAAARGVAAHLEREQVGSGVRHRV